MTYAPPRFKGYYERHGSGPAVLCLSGFGCDGWIFQNLTQSLADSYQLIIPDNRGMGQSPPATDEYTIEDLADDALALMTDLGYDTFAVLGISMGGFIAQALCLKAPARVERVILLCATSNGPEFIPLPEVSEQDLKAGYTLDPTDLAVKNTELTTHPTLKQRDPQTFDLIVNRKINHRAQLDQLLMQQKAVYRFLDDNLSLEAIQCPALVLSGDSDRFVAPKNSELLAQRIPQAELHFIADTDHLFFLEKGDEVSQLIRNFLEAQ